MAAAVLLVVVVCGTGAIGLLSQVVSDPASAQVLHVYSNTGDVTVRPSR